jgi:hypothetical protein
MVVLLVVAVLGAVLISCKTQNNAPAFVGTWSQSASGETVTWVFTTNTVSVTATGLLTGSMDWSIQAIDEGSNHIQMSQTSATGIYATVPGTPNGTAYYMTYSVSGNSLYISSATTTYPAAATAGPYTRQ